MLAMSCETIETPEELMTIEKEASTSASTVTTEDSSSTTIGEDGSLSAVAKGVRFDNDKDTSTEVLCREDYSEEEIETTWYNKQECMDMKNSCLRAAEMYSLSQGGTNLSNKKWGQVEEALCIRGVEYLVEANKERKEYIRTLAVEALLNEQYEQMNAGIKDYDKLADVYEQSTAISKLEALKAGKADEEVAARIREEDRAEAERKARGDDINDQSGRGRGLRKFVRSISKRSLTRNSSGDSTSMKRNSSGESLKGMRRNYSGDSLLALRRITSKEKVKNGGMRRVASSGGISPPRRRASSDNKQR